MKGIHVPTTADVELAAAGACILEHCAIAGNQATLRITGSDQEIVVPESAIRILADILNEMALGNAMMIESIPTELSTRQASELLNVSLPYLQSEILDRGALPFHIKGTHRRINLKDLLEYRAKQKAEGQKILESMAQLSQQHGLMGD